MDFSNFYVDLLIANQVLRIIGKCEVYKLSAYMLAI